MTKTYLDQLEDESIFIFREVAAEFERPVILYSAGKDSSVLLHLAKKAFAPDKIPFPLLHVDTGFKFPEMYSFRDQTVKDLGLELLVYSHSEAHQGTTNPWSLGTKACCETLKTRGLIEALNHYKIDGAIGGARREEEKSRAKERFFSIRNQQGGWDPRQQRLESQRVFNTRLANGESMRVFPLSNWTELDIWRYIGQEQIPVVPLYFAEQREVLKKGGMYLPLNSGHTPTERSQAQVEMVRFRTLGCVPCTGAVLSPATTIEEIILELESEKVSERSTRLIDHDCEGSMEKKKRDGYF